MTHTSVRSRLYQLKMRKDEKVGDFCERFDSIIRKYKSCGDTVPLTEQEKRSSFYQAVSSIIPELRNADFIQRQTFSKEITLEEIKSFILQLEAEKKSEKREEIRVQRQNAIGATAPGERLSPSVKWAVVLLLLPSSKIPQR